jgi:hypothetical protein
MKYSEIAVHKILRMESEEGLFDLSISGINVYQHMRMVLYYHAMQHSQHYQAQPVPSYKDYMSNARSYLSHSMRQNDFWGIPSSDVAVIEFDRRINDGNGKQFNIFMDPILDALNNQCCVIRFPRGGHYDDEANYCASLMYFDYFAIKRRLLRYRRPLSPIDLKKVMTAISGAFKKHIDESLCFEEIIRSEIYKAVYGIRVARRLFRKMSAKILILMGNAALTALIEAAHDVGMSVVEFQHGIISKYHLGYHFPICEKGSLKGYPDYILTYGEYWNRAVDYPLQSSHIIPVGFPCFELQKRQVTHIKKKKNQILFLSQMVVGKSLAEMAIQIARRLPDYKVVFKLHPKQYRNWKELLPNLSSSSVGNLEIVTDSGRSLYALFAESAYQVGAFSTSLIEGLSFDLKTIICKLPGHEWMDGIMDYADCSLAENVSDILKIIRSSQSNVGGKKDPDLLFSVDSMANMKQALSNIRSQ